METLLLLKTKKKIQLINDCFFFVLTMAKRNQTDTPIVARNHRSSNYN